MNLIAIYTMKPQNKWLIMTLFAVAMGLLECIVVVYLRQLCYPAGFSFPLKPMNPGILRVELLREMATLLMLLSVGLLAGENRIRKFAWFLYAFAVWDLFYYVFLKLLIHWPASLLSWDILFLLPATWVGPVIAPLLNSLNMILLALILLRQRQDPGIKAVNAFEWVLLIAGSLILILAYTREYSSFMLNRFSPAELLNPANSAQLIAYAGSFIPRHFDWGIYTGGMLMHWLAIGGIYRRARKGIR